MASQHADHDFITKRQQEYVANYNNFDLEKIVSYFADDIDYSDFGIGALHMNKEAVRTFMTQMYSALANVKVDTISISGHKHFTAWEWNLTCNYVKGFEGETQGGGEAAEEFSEANADGREIRMVGCSVTWWDEQGEKIVKNCDYAKKVDSFVGR